MIVRPETVIGWHRKGFRAFWTWKSRRGNPCLIGQNSLMGRVSLPGPLCVYDKHMTKLERAQRDGRV